jgi:hypothetical protein
MIRPFTFITMMLAAISGAYLFAVKHRAQVMDDQIAQLADQSRLDDQRIRVLQAQWALEIDPTRLQQLANRFTALQPMQPAQLVTFATLQAQLPAANTPPPANAPATPALTVAANATPAAAALPLPPPLPPAPPVGMSSANVAFAESVVRSLRDTHSSLHLAAARSVETLPPPRPLYVAPRAVMAQSSLPIAPIGAQVMSVKASAAPEQNSGSLLGMAAELPPPQPLASGAEN